MKTAFLALFFILSSAVYAEICDPKDENSFVGFDKFINDNKTACENVAKDDRSYDGVLEYIGSIMEQPLEEKQKLCLEIVKFCKADEYKDYYRYLLRASDQGGGLKGFFVNKDECVFYKFSSLKETTQTTSKNLN